MTKKHNSGFCGTCGFYREDTIVQEGDQTRNVPDIDCRCSAALAHSEECRYFKAVTCPVSIGCEHGYDVCATCDACDCGGLTEAAYADRKRVHLLQARMRYVSSTAGEGPMPWEQNDTEEAKGESPASQ